MDILTVNDRPGEYPASWYAATAPIAPPAPEARGAISCDVCVVGGGYTGLSAALALAERGMEVVLVEAHRLGWGASGRNGGQVNPGQRVDQDALERSHGPATARRLWEMGLASVDLVHELIAAHRIDCHYVPGVIHADHRARFVPETHAYAAKLARDYGYGKIRPLSRDEIRHLVGSSAYHGGSLDMGGGHLHPLCYALGLARATEAAGVRFFERTRVAGIEPGDPVVLATPRARIRARYVILGCNGYLGGLAPRVAARVMPINNFIVATEPLGEESARSLIRENHAVGDSRFVINYFRLSQDNRLLFGGGETYGYRFPADIAATVRKPMLKVFPQLRDVRIDHAWGGTLGITMTRMPHVARLAGNILSAGGYSGHGVAMATFAGRVMAEALAGQAGRFDLMASIPTPRFPGGARFRTPLLALAMTWYALRDRF